MDGKYNFILNIIKMIILMTAGVFGKFLLTHEIIQQFIKQTNSLLETEYISFLLIIIYIIIVVSFFVFIEKLLISLIERSQLIRRILIGKEYFVEGRWFNATIINKESIRDYAIIHIEYYNGEYRIRGELYDLIDGKVTYIGMFESLLQKFSYEDKVLKYSYTRDSLYEKETLVDSFGTGMYRFKAYTHRKMPLRLTGNYFDPIKDEMMSIIGIKIKEPNKIKLLWKNIKKQKEAEISILIKKFHKKYPLYNESK